MECRLSLSNAVPVLRHAVLSLASLNIGLVCAQPENVRLPGSKNAEKGSSPPRVVTPRCCTLHTHDDIRALVSRQAYMQTASLLPSVPVTWSARPSKTWLSSGGLCMQSIFFFCGLFYGQTEFISAHLQALSFCQTSTSTNVEDNNLRRVQQYSLRWR